MKNALYIDFENNAIVMTSTFAKKCSNTSSDEYRQLQSVRRDYPAFTVTTRQIKKNPHMEHYNGLTYAFMEDYIITHESDETRKAVLDEFNELILVSKCHSKAFRYPTIKKWFLKRYPEIVEFGMPQTFNSKVVETEFTATEDVA